MSGQYTHLTFKRGIHIQAQTRLVSYSMPLPQADAWLQHFESDELTRGLFTLEEL
jgi:hypothetical protein